MRAVLRPENGVVADGVRVARGGSGERVVEGPGAGPANSLLWGSDGR